MLHLTNISLIQQKIDQSNRIIEQMLSLSSNPYLALSFGKDSLVMYDLVRRQYPEIPCLFLQSRESLLLHNYTELFDYYKRVYNINLAIVHSTAIEDCNFDWWIYKDAPEVAFTQDAFFGSFDGVFMGIRIEESRKRKISLTLPQNNRLGSFIMQYKTGRRKGMYRCCPMAQWTNLEIRIYAYHHNLKLLDAYQDNLTQRTSSWIHDAVEQRGIESLKRRNPNAYNEIILIMPEIRHYS